MLAAALAENEALRASQKVLKEEERAAEMAVQGICHPSLVPT